MTRLEANRVILRYIVKVIETNPDLRFWQALSAIGLNEPTFYEESVSTQMRARQGYERFLSLLRPEVFGGPDDPQDG